MTEIIRPVELTFSSPPQPIIYPLPGRAQELRRLKTELIGIRRAQLKLVKQIEETIEAVDQALLQY